MSQTETATKTEAKPTNPPKAAASKRPKPAAKPKGKAKAHVPARAVLEKLVGKKVKYIGRNEKWHGKSVELRAVRTTKDAPAGYDVRLALGESTQYCSIASIKLA